MFVERASIDAPQQCGFRPMIQTRRRSRASTMEGFERPDPACDKRLNRERKEMTEPSSPRLAARPIVTGFFERRTFSIQYVLADPETKHCAIIDPVLDFDPKSGATGTHSADALTAHIDQEGYTVEWILDTHPHADHFSAAGYLNGRTGASTAIGEKVVEVQKLWKRIYNLSDDFPTDGSQWDRLLADGERFRIGNMDVEVIFSPGHTLASITYIVGDAAFIHDTIFMPDGGTARADFPGGSASVLWDSIERIMALPAKTRLFTGHDYCPGGRKPRWESTVAQQRAENIHLTKATTKEEFVVLRETSDRRLPMPALILASLQVNIRGGRLPEPENNGRRYLKIPLDALSAPWDE
jgi:glyoxylase-like metal-dependent hydrolase (beta-lactamase superfamily II)